MTAIKSQFSKFAWAATAMVALAVAANSAMAQDKVQSKVQDKTQAQDQLKDQVFGYQLMTDAERTEYRSHMRSLKTAKEREAFRLEHHKLMQERAREQGVTLPATPPAMGRGMGPGAAAGGMRAGPGAGGGMGAGGPAMK